MRRRKAEPNPSEASTDRGWKPRLPVRDLRGRFLVSEHAIMAAERLLPSFRGPDGDHEGIVFLLGHEAPSATLITTVLAPEADHGWDHVICSEDQFAAATTTAHSHGLGILGQLHTHGNASTEHSVGDDTLILMPFEGSLSLIAPWYGRVGLRPLHGLGVHQYQDGRWVLIHPDGVREHMHLLPSSVDLR